MLGVVVACMLLASVAHADEPTVGQKIDAIVDDGEAWNLDVPKLVTLLGTPATATADQIEWASMQGDKCAYVVATADADGYLKDWNAYTSGEQGEHWPTCKKLLGKKAKLPAKLRGPGPKLDADAQTTAIMALWGAGSYAELYDASHPGLQEQLGSPDTLARIAKLFEQRAGKFVKLGAPLEHGFKHYGWTVSAPVIYEKGTLHADLTFHAEKGKPMLTNIHLTLPDELIEKRDPKEAAKVARADLDLLLAGKTATFYEHMQWDLPNKMPRATLDAKLPGVLKNFGKVKSIKQTDQSDCGDDHQCFTYEVVGANGTGKATLELDFNIAEWLIVGFNLDAP